MLSLNLSTRILLPFSSVFHAHCDTLLNLSSTVLFYFPRTLSNSPHSFFYRSLLFSTLSLSISPHLFLYRSLLFSTLSLNISSLILLPFSSVFHALHTTLIFRSIITHNLWQSVLHHNIHDWVIIIQTDLLWLRQ